MQWAIDSTLLPHVYAAARDTHVFEQYRFRPLRFLCPTLRIEESHDVVRWKLTPEGLRPACVEQPL